METEKIVDASVGTGPLPEDLTIVDPALEARVADERAAPPEPTHAPEAVPEVPAASEPERDRIRVAFVTYEDVFTEGSLAAERYRAYGKDFEEVHVIVPVLGDKGFDGIQIAENVWVYPTNSSFWWMYPYDAYRVARRQLTFAGSFRPDVITTTDPFELGMIGWIIARWWKRPLVVEASERLYDASFLEENTDNAYRAWLARLILPRAERIRARSIRLRDMVARAIPGSGERIDVVPRYIDGTAYERSEDSLLLRDRYPQFSFIILVVAALGKGSGVDFAINAASHALRQYPSIGMLVLGEGSDLEPLAQFVIDKGLAGKVYIETMPDDIAPYLRSAHMLIMPKAALLSEEVLMNAAAAGLPVLVSKDAVIEEVFVDQESAKVCAQNDMGCVIQGITSYMNDSITRKRHADEARRRAHDAVERAYRDGQHLMRGSLEAALLSWYERHDRQEREASSPLS